MRPSLKVESDWLKWSRYDVTVTLYSENGFSFLKITPTALDNKTSDTHSGSDVSGSGW